MKRSVRVFAPALLMLCLAGSARAASVVISEENPNLGVVNLYVSNSLDVGIGKVTLIAGGGYLAPALGITLDPTNAAISTSDSAYLVHPVAGYSFDELIIAGLPGQAIVPAHTTVRLGQFQMQDPYAFLPVFLAPGETVIPDVGPAFPATLYDATGAPIVPSSIEAMPTQCSAFCSVGIVFTVPEPEPSFLLVAIVALALGLRSARPLLRR